MTSFVKESLLKELYFPSEANVELHSKGYVIIDAGETRGEVICRWGLDLKAKKNELTNGPCRYVHKFASKAVRKEIADSLQNVLKREMLMGHRFVTPCDVCAISNYPDAPDQELHTDYPETTFTMHKEKMPLSVLWAVRADFYLRTRETRLLVSRGRMIVFRPDFEHAGCTGKEQSSAFRIHAYIQSRGVRSPTNKTYTLTSSEDSN